MTNDIFKKIEELKKKPINPDKSWIEKNEAVLMEHMRNNPISSGVRDNELVRQHRKLTDASVPRSDIKGFSSLTAWFLRPMPVLIALALVFTGSLSAAAQGSVPGDTLYGWKINVNEKIISAVTVGSKNSTELEVRLTKERLEEMNEVSADANASAEVKAESRANLEAQARKAKESIVKLSESGNAETAAELDMELEAMGIDSNINIDGSMDVDVDVDGDGNVDSDSNIDLNSIINLDNSASPEPSSSVSPNPDASPSPTPERNNSYRLEGNVNGSGNVGGNANVGN